MLVAAVLMMASGASAVEYVNDTFSYADGSLVGNGGWASHSGTAGDFQVVSGQAVVEHGAPSEDVNHPFVLAAGGDVYFSFDYSVDDLGFPWTGTDTEYFAHFKNDGSTYRARLDIVPALGGGDYTLGISSSTSTAQNIWPMDLAYGVVYHVVVRYNQDFNIAELWVDASAELDFSILGDDDADPGTVITQFAMRQSDSEHNETVRIDNVIVGDACEDVFTTCGPVATEAQSWGDLKSLYR